MKANELRIGNYVETNIESKKYKEIDVNHLDISLLVQFKGRRYKPILITEQWLIDLGFEMRESSSCKAYYIGKNEITKDWLFDLVWLDKPELINAPNVPFYRNGRHTLYYVHQLQNLYFALTGEELTKLKP